MFGRLLLASKDMFSILFAVELEFVHFIKVIFNIHILFMTKIHNFLITIKLKVYFVSDILFIFIFIPTAVPVYVYAKELRNDAFLKINFEILRIL